MPTPVIYFAFSNDIENPLSSLKEESRNVYQALVPLEDKRQIKIMRDENASTDDIINTLQRLADPTNDFELVAFHYGGHADGSGIHLVDDGGNATGLAELLATFKETLSLVFLNGCSTKAQVVLLMQLGIKSVIATSAPIEDRTATEFGGIFYRKLAVRSTIRLAFDFAAAAIQLKGGQKAETIPVDVTRGLMLPNQSPSTKLPWSLNYDHQQEQVLEWSLPYDRPVMGSDFDQEEVQLNEYLLDIVFEMAHFDDEIRKDVEDEDVVDDELFALIIRSFPWVISSQLQVLKSAIPAMQQPTVDRLKQMLSAYISASQVIYYAALSWLWHLKAEEKIIKGNLDYEDVCEIEKEEFPMFDFVQQTQVILREIDNQHQDPYVQELVSIIDSFKEQDDFYQAYFFLQSKREQYFQGGLNRFQSAIHSVCLETEYHLAIFLKKITFLVSYQMVTCRKVNIRTNRGISVSYEHFISKLHANQDGINVSKEPLEFDGSVLDARSVLLLRNKEKGKRSFLPLTPFIIDKNAYFDQNPYGNIKDNSTNVYVYAYTVNAKSEDAAYFYIKCGDNLLDWAIAEDSFQVHKISTDQEMKRRSKPLVRRRHRRPTVLVKPLAVLKEQFQQLKKDWAEYE